MYNALKTAVLLGALTGLIVFLGNNFGGQQGMIIAFGFAVVMNFTSYWFSDKIVLAMYGAKEAGQSEAPEVHAAVDELVARAGIPKPRVYIIDSPQPNAFATGRNPQHAAVAVTTGILRILNRDELKGVLAHELSHVRNRDILIGSVAATLAGVVMMIANMARWAAMFGGVGGGRDSEERGGGAIGLIAMSILAPLAAMLIQMAISRAREYQADAAGAQLSANPYALASALEKLQTASQRIPMPQAGTATAHMFIVNPFSGRSLMNLFSTHPPTEERVRRLRSMAF